MNEQQADVMLGLLASINTNLQDVAHELKHHNNNAKDRTDGIEEAIREVGQTVADGLKALDLLVPKE